ncbi:MAG TPA: hypothetical protein VG488_08735 [Candidatus Angelobacter sp.]|jgi:hypothetical protein|nr:hypothetical protein [Candidatus Angelobacter sp.]
MLRSAFSVILLAFAMQAAQAQFHGVPASATSPTSNGNSSVVLHGVPSSVTSPAPSPITSDQIRFPGRQHFRAHFGGPHAAPHHKFVPVPVFYPVYDYPADYAAPPVDQPVQPATAETDSSSASAPTDAEALRQAYYQGAHDAIADQQADGRYGSHYLDSREKRQSRDSGKDSAAAQSDPKPSIAASDSPRKEQPDDSPATVFVFKDGHKIETHNYAIVGQTLFDFSSKPLKKLQIADLDVDATRKANYELGISLTLP